MNTLRSEWVKLRSVSRWVITLVGAVALTIGLSYLAAAGNKQDPRIQERYASSPGGDPVSDRFYFVHQPVTGDATLTVRIASLSLPPNRPMTSDGEGQTLEPIVDPSPFAQPAAGIMIKDGTRPGSSYASLMLTANQGVHMQWDFDADRSGTTSVGTRWLRLVRSGNMITGYESADGSTWRPVATATPAQLPSTVEVGFYVSAPDSLAFTRGGGSSSLAMRSMSAIATIDNVQLAATTGAGGSARSWQGQQVGELPIDSDSDNGGKAGRPEPGRVSEADGVYTVGGTGKIGPNPPDDDMVETALFGVIAGLMALIAVGVLYATSEYRRGMIRTTFAATPNRGRVLAAKTFVLGSTSFVIGLIGAVGAFALGIPLLRRNGFAPPAFPEPSLMDGAVLRAILLTAAFMAGVAVVGLAVGLLVRRSAAAITITVVLVLLPLIVGMILPNTSPRWLMYTTLAGGLATQRAKPPTITLAEPWAMIGPWAGISVVAAWVVVALGVAWWQLRRRDA